MDHKTKVAVVAISALWLCCLIISAHEEQPTAPTMTETMKTSVNQLWIKMKADINRLQAYFFPPNIDFRGGRSSGDEAAAGEGGAGEKVKEAVAKSFDKCKSTVEDSARSAAHLAKDKVKHTLSDMEAAEADADADADEDDAEL